MRRAQSSWCRFVVEQMTAPRTPAADPSDVGATEETEFGDDLPGTRGYRRPGRHGSASPHRGRCMAARQVRSDAGAN